MFSRLPRVGDYPVHSTVCHATRLLDNRPPIVCVGMRIQLIDADSRVVMNCHNTICGERLPSLNITQTLEKNEVNTKVPKLDELNAEYTECIEERARYSDWIFFKKKNNDSNHVFCIRTKQKHVVPHCTNCLASCVCWLVCVFRTSSAGILRPVTLKTSAAVQHVVASHIGKGHGPDNLALS